MSNVGQAALIVVGTVVGFEVGYPALGFALGSLAGSVLFPTQMPAGPKIGDNRTTTSSIGDPVALVYGTADVAGTIMWLAPYVQTTHGSKGGASQTTYSYTQSIAIGLCSGPILGISRIWENGAIVYDVRPQLAANPDMNRLAETDEEYATRLSVSATYAETFVLYLGDELQEADPTIESIQGMGNVPAFRGLAYIVYPNRALQTTQAWRHPNFKFETVAPTEIAVTGSGYSQGVLYPWSQNEGNISLYYPIPPGNMTVTTANVGQGYATLAQAQAAGEAAYFGGAAMPSYLGYAIQSPATASALNTSGGPTTQDPPGLPDPPSINMHFNAEGASFLVGDVNPNGQIEGAKLVASGVYTTPGATWWSAGVLYKNSSTLASLPAPTPAEAPFSEWYQGQTYWYAASRDLMIVCVRGPGAPGYVAGASSQGLWAREGTVNVLQEINMGALMFSETQTTDQPLYSAFGPCLPPSDPNYNSQAFWDAAYATAVAAGQMQPGFRFGFGYPVATGRSWKFVGPAAATSSDGGAGVWVSDIIRLICARAGLPAVDVSDMTSIKVDGYSVSSISDGASILTPLRSVAFFDAVESNGVLKFQARGKASVATFTTDDFGAYDASKGGGKEVPPSITTVRAQDEDLPRSIRLRYKATALDYQDSEQLSPYRLQTLSVNDTDVSLAICMSDSLALQCAEVLWADTWAARIAYTLSVDQAWLALDCGDCIDVPVDGVMQRMRIVSDKNASGVLRTLSCVRDDGDAFVSTAVAQPIQQVPQKLALIAPTSYELLDLPALQDADNDAGFYIAAQRQGGAGIFKGAQVYESSDGGATFATLFALTSESTAGTLSAAVPASQALTWDTSTTVTVNVPANFSFESVTDAAVIAGANAAAMGADGRWEVVQFANATQVTTTQWALSRLLRGRRGTEHVCGSSIAGDALVLLSQGALGRVTLQTGSYGASRIYKVVSIGATYSSGIDTTFAGHAQALMPFSPADLHAVYVGGDIVITWIRRSRLGRTLMSGSDIALNEETEAYQVDIYSASSPPTVLRTLAVTTQSATYTAADQLADFGAGTIESIGIKVYQISAVVGRGTPASATINL